MNTVIATEKFVQVPLPEGKNDTIHQMELFNKRMTADIERSANSIDSNKVNNIK